MGLSIEAREIRMFIQNSHCTELMLAAYILLANNAGPRAVSHANYLSDSVEPFCLPPQTSNDTKLLRGFPEFKRKKYVHTRVCMQTLSFE